MHASVSQQFLPGPKEGSQKVLHSGIGGEDGDQVARAAGAV